MSELITELHDDLAAEHADLVALLRDQPERVWKKRTPTPGWNVRDQIAHLAHFDSMARLCITNPDSFIALRESIADLQTYVDDVGTWRAGDSGAEMLAWWGEEHQALCAAARAADPTVRVPWFGPAMSLASKLTARLMETWAHGQDVTDALGQWRRPTARLRHVARIGVLAFPNSYRVRGLEAPNTEVRVELTPPDGGEKWTWGDPACPDTVAGSAEHFCLVVTQRRHLADTDLDVRGQVARHWMSIAQAFAGPPGEGRSPGQFTRHATPTESS